MKYLLLIFLIIEISSYTPLEKQVWDFLVGQAGLTKAGAAGLMGNLDAESGMTANIYEDAYKSKLGLTDQEYVDYVNDGRYSEYDFVHDGIGFGLAQWSYYIRKQALINTCRGQIGSMSCQLRYLQSELTNYYISLNSFLKSSNSVRDCAIKVLFEFENPADKGTNVQNKRIQLAQNYYYIFAGGSF